MRSTGVNPETNMHTKLIAFIKLANIHLNHFPNHEKFGLCTQIRNCMYDVYIAGLEATIQAEIKNIVKDYPQFEIDTFATQEREANAYMKDNEAPTPFIDNLCLNRGIEKNVMVAKILANAEALKLATAPIIGQYQKIVSTK